MVEDWRFTESPQVASCGLRAYAGVPLHFETEHGEFVAFGSLCVASNSPQKSLSKSQQSALGRLANWIVADIIHSARARRQRDRRAMLAQLAKAQKQCDSGMDMEVCLLEMLREVYPSATVGVHRTTEGQFVLEGGTPFRPSDLEDGLWEDGDYFDHVIKKSNHLDMVAPRVVRVIAAACASQRTPTYLVVGSRDFRTVYDDIDAWFVHMCASMLCQYWQGNALKEAMAAKEIFLRGITHQLRTPIHGILGSVELLTEELIARSVVPATPSASPQDSPESQQVDPYVYIKTIRTSARDLITTINSLIKLNRWADTAQAERAVTLHTASDVVAAILNETVPALSDDLSTRPCLIIQHYLPPNLDTFALDLRLLLDSIQPLIVNATQNTSGGVVCVTLSVTEDLGSLIVDVEDNGCGIAPTNCERIFDAYAKVDMHTSESGLGLTLACKSATLLGGQVTLVSSTPNVGSHFRAIFPEPTCASSYPPRRSFRDRLVQLPSTFHRVSSTTKTSSLGLCFSRYLSHHGYVPVESPSGSLVILDYTPDLAQLYKHTSVVDAGQVAICLVPESAYFLEFHGERIKVQDNIVFVQGPFLPDVLEDALKQADTVLAAIGTATLDAGSCPFGGVALDSPSLPSSTTSVESPLALQHRASIFPQNVQAEVAQSMQNLNIRTKPPAPRVPSTMQLSKPQALLVDDNAVNLRLLEMYCTRRGIPYQSATNGRQAVELFSKSCSPPADANNALLRQGLLTQRYDLILMDLQMPICDGIDATRQIRGLERDHGLDKSVLFIVTGQDSPKDRSDANEAGADGYLVKPVGPKALDQWVKQWFPNADI